MASASKSPVWPVWVVRPVWVRVALCAAFVTALALASAPFARAQGGHDATAHDAQAGEDAVGNAMSSLFLTPTSCARNVFTGMFELDSALHAASGREALAQGRLVQVALVFDGPRSRLSIYADGILAGRATVPFQLAQIHDVNNWLGRSQWVQDRHLRGRFEELRIYAGALDAGHDLADDLLAGGGVGAWARAWR
jgi:hypothetical protein